MQRTEKYHPFNIAIVIEIWLKTTEEAYRKEGKVETKVQLNMKQY